MTGPQVERRGPVVAGRNARQLELRCAGAKAVKLVAGLAFFSGPCDINAQALHARDDSADSEAPLGRAGGRHPTFG